MNMQEVDTDNGCGLAYETTWVKSLYINTKVVRNGMQTMLNIRTLMPRDKLMPIKAHMLPKMLDLFSNKHTF